MSPGDIITANTQLTQVSHNYAIVLEQINKIPLDRKDEIGALREAVRALMNSSQMLNAVCVLLFRQFTERG
jgi:hypothetical protein